MSGNFQLTPLSDQIRILEEKYDSDRYQIDKEAGRTKKFSTEERILLQNQWALDEKLLARLNIEQRFYCPLSTFLERVKKDECNPWQYKFTCQNLERATNKMFDGSTSFSCSFFFCTHQYLELLEFAIQSTGSPNPYVSFKIRINTYNKFFHCIVKLNQSDWSADRVSKSFQAFPTIFSQKSKSE